MFRKKTLFAAMLMAGLSNPASALGLGEMTVNSSLFQPLRAEIELYGWTKVSLANIRAELASQNAFLRARIDRPYFLQGLRMEVVQLNKTDAIVSITSTRPIAEPIVEFLLDVEWPGGVLQRRYTAFLDPPITVANVEKPTVAATPAPAPAPQVSKKLTTGDGGSAVVPTQAAPVQPATASVAPASVETYRVRRGDTLGKLVKQLGQGLDGTTNQLMIAIVDVNPDAFVDQNINALRNGAELRAPSQADVDRFPAARANRMVSEQYAAWRNRATGQALAQAPEPQPQVAEPAAEPAPAPGLTLAPTVEPPQSAAAQGGQATRLQTELAQTRQRLFEREAELDVLLSRMAVYESELKALRERMNALPAEQASGSAITESQSGAAVDLPARPVVRLTDLWNEHLNLVIAALLIGLGGIGLGRFVARRLAARQDAVDVHTPHIPKFDERPDSEMPRNTLERTANSTAVEIIAEPAIRPAELSPTEVREIVPAAGGHSGERAIAEVDVLLQFSFFQRAAELMQEALENEPGNNQYRLKLMEVYHASSDADRFLAEARLMHESLLEGQQELWSSACEMGVDLCPGVELFDQPFAATGEAVESDTPASGDQMPILDISPDGSGADEPNTRQDWASPDIAEEEMLLDDELDISPEPELPDAEAQPSVTTDDGPVNKLEGANPDQLQQDSDLELQRSREGQSLDDDGVGGSSNIETPGFVDGELGHEWKFDTRSGESELEAAGGETSEYMPPDEQDPQDEPVEGTSEWRIVLPDAPEGIDQTAEHGAVTGGAAAPEVTREWRNITSTHEPSEPNETTEFEPLDEDSDADPETEPDDATGEWHAILPESDADSGPAGTAPHESIIPGESTAPHESMIAGGKTTPQPGAETRPHGGSTRPAADPASPEPDEQSDQETRRRTAQWDPQDDAPAPTSQYAAADPGSTGVHEVGGKRGTRPWRGTEESADNPTAPHDAAVQRTQQFRTDKSKK